MQKKKINDNKLKFKGRCSNGFIFLNYTILSNYLFFLKNSRIEYKYITILKKFLKKLKSKRIKAQRTFIYKFYLSLKGNYILSKKSKNARMGKGKGAIIRHAIKVKKFKPYVYVIGYRHATLCKLAKSYGDFINKKTKYFSYLGYNKLYTWSTNKYNYSYSNTVLLK